MKNRVLKKIKREIVSGLSKVYVRYVRTNYFGLKLKVPLIYGMRNGGYILPAERWMSDCLSSFIKVKKGCVLDIGVNVGLYLVKLKAITDNVNYYGIEANPACSFYTNELIRINHFRSSKVFTIALGESQSVSTFYASKLADGTGSLIEAHQAHNNKEYTFDTLVVTGDSILGDIILDKDISVIKIDVEEAELYVLKGMINTILKYKPFIYIEILFTTTLKQEQQSIEICRFLQNIGYSILGINLKTKKLDVINDIGKVGKEYAQEYIFSHSDYIDDFMLSISKNSSGVEI